MRLRLKILIYSFWQKGLEYLINIGSWVGASTVGWKGDFREISLFTFWHFHKLITNKIAHFEKKSEKSLFDIFTLLKIGRNFPE